MEEIIFLGTGSASSVNFYNSCFALRKGNEYMLVDGGGGKEIFMQLAKAKISFKSIRHIFVTHNHIDHIIGVIWIIRKIAILMKDNKYDGIEEDDKVGYDEGVDINIYAAAETIDAIRILSKLTLAKTQSDFIDKRIILNIVKDRECIEILEEDFTFYDVKAKKEKQYGFKLTMKNGKILVCNGDEPCAEENFDLLQNADYLVHEAFCLDSEKEEKEPYKKAHVTAKDVCDIANRLNIKNLILFHISSEDALGRKEKYISENEDHYNGNLFIPNDLERIEL
ncbi:MAG: MBL fold metallo-hydrolase [Oscillospiraceae bacterium]|nr:MBL fold metallo-hydrolase [Oscillospiraceae bacterium]